MNASDAVILIIVAMLVTAALLYLRKAKQKGKHCVGCPDSCSCTGRCSCAEKRKKGRRIAK